MEVAAAALFGDRSEPANTFKPDVIPAQAGIHLDRTFLLPQIKMDSRFSRE
jgi:hypothetical protein